MKQRIPWLKRSLLCCLILPLVLSTDLFPQEVPEDRPSVEELTTPAEAMQGAVLIPAEGEGAVQIGDQGRRPGTGELENLLVTPNGEIFHRTKNQVRDLRTLPVPGTSLRLYLWEELLEDGEAQAFYAVSQAGSHIRGRVRTASYLIRLHDHIFDPLLSTPKIRPSLEARPDCDLFLVQFWTTPLPEFRQALTILGGKVHRFLTDHTFIVEMSPETRALVESLPYVRWAGSFHPEYRVEDFLRKALADEAAPLEEQRYSIMVCERGTVRQQALSNFILTQGGLVHFTTPEGYRMEATLTQDQLMEVIHRNEVQYVDRWGGPGETDMNIVRQVGGADYIEGITGWSGEGVRGEIFDTEILTTHQEWPTAPIIHSNGTSMGSLHGTSCYSINFAQGVQADARGLVPGGQGIFFLYNESTQFGGTKSRYEINQELIDPSGPYRAVFQTASVGSNRTTLYTTISAEVDDYLFLHQLLSTQSQSNAGDQMSRPQAWAKNIVAVGGMYHYGTADRSDDHWGGGASIGPAEDGRVKPDLAYFYDQIYSARGSGNTSYTQFGGTSAATPETAGHFGLLFQMWHEQVFDGFGGGADVFDSRPKMATAKALMINGAYRYDWTSGGANGDINRNVQGWGTANVQNLYDRADGMEIINESDVITPLQTKTYQVTVDAGQSELNVTMVYTDPMGTPGAAHARINDLSLKVTSPGGTVYWGNNGLHTDNWSDSGGSSNTIDTAENVFIQNPEAGDWTVEVIADELVEDAHSKTSAIDAVYGLVISGGQIEEDVYAPLPDYTYTYSSSGHTRGYWFTAPVDFTITGLQVPDEQSHGLHNVEVIRFDPGVTPPTYSQTTNEFTSLFRATGLPSNQVIDAAVPVKAGDVIGILGACGDASIMHNSYGNGPFVSEIFGQPATFTRMGMQHNLVTTPASDIWTSGGSIARVKMFYGPPEVFEAPLPDFTNTYSNATRTRGYWFTAPTDFAITGLQVPDEAGHGLQNVEVVRFDPGVTPPAWSQTTNAFTSLFRSTGTSSNQVLDVLIPVYDGEVIGILGACGDTAMMHNSYGNGPFTSEIFGQSVTFARMGMQFNLAAYTARDLWTENYKIGRVKLFYGDPVYEAPLSAYTNTYSNATRTRGYWFTAPVDFTIVGLQVPDETGHGLQNVEVVRFDPGVTPPAYSQTTNEFTSLWRSVGTSSGDLIQVLIPVEAGDVIGILGACGDTSMMHNSYGSGPFTSEIFGQPVTFARMGMQFNLAAYTARDLWTENYNIARVKLLYK